MTTWPKNIPDQRSNQSPSWMEAAGMWMPSGQMVSLSMLTILGLILRRGSGLPRSRKRGFKNTPYLSNQNDPPAGKGRTKQGEKNMDKDRIQGSLEQAKGKVKEVAGKVTGDAKLETEGKTQQVAGKIQNAVGGFKDAVKEAVKD